MNEFTFSPHGISSIDAYKLINTAFIDYCMERFKHGTFSSYCDGEPVFLSSGFEFSHRQFERQQQAALDAAGRNK